MKIVTFTIKAFTVIQGESKKNTSTRKSPYLCKAIIFLCQIFPVYSLHFSAYVCWILLH